MSFWDLFLSEEERAKKKAEEIKRINDAKILKQNKEKRVRELLDETVKHYGETKVIETEAKIRPTCKHTTKLVITEKRVIFTEDSRWDDAIKDFVVVDIPYRDMNHMYFDYHDGGKTYSFVKEKMQG